MNHQVIRLAILPCAVMCACQAQAAASSALAEDVIELAPVVVTATRTPSRIDLLPASADKVTSDELENAQAYSASEILKGLPNVDFGGGARPAAQIPTIRGYSGKEITLLLDGARLNDASGISSPLYIDPYQLASVEVVRSPSSSLYGSGGLGGVMAFRTLSARDLLVEGQSVGGDLRVGHASADDSQHYNARAYLKNGAFDALASIGHADWGRIRQGGGTYLAPNDGHSDSALVKLGYQPSDKLRLQLSYQSYSEDNFRPNNPQADSALGSASSVPVQMNRTNQEQTVFSLNTFDDAGEADIGITLYQSQLKRNADKNPAFPMLAATNSLTDTTGGSFQDTLHFGGKTVAHQLTYGFDYYQDQQSAASAGAANPVIPNGKQEVYGVFVQDEISLGAGWRLIPSLRADHYNTSVDSGKTPVSQDKHVSPKLAFSWQATPSTNLYASYAEGYRAPSLSEMYMNLSGRNYLFNFAPNTGLKAETDHTLEAGASYKRENLLAGGDSVLIKASAFATRVSDLISTVVIGSYSRTAPFAGTGLIQQAQNIRDAKRVGGELTVNYQRGHFALDAGYSRIRVVDANSDTKLFSPPDKLSVQLRQVLGDSGVSVQWNGLFVAAQDYDSTILRRTAGYGVSDVSLSWKPARAKSLRVDFGIGNLFDKRYISYQSSNIVAKAFEAGRNVKLAVSTSF